MSHVIASASPIDTMPSERANRLDQVWSQLCDADRHVLLGHASAQLSNADRVELARALDRVGQALRGRRRARRRR